MVDIALVLMLAKVNANTSVRRQLAAAKLLTALHRIRTPDVSVGVEHDASMCPLDKCTMREMAGSVFVNGQLRKGVLRHVTFTGTALRQHFAANLPSGVPEQQSHTISAQLPLLGNSYRRVEGVTLTMTVEAAYQHLLPHTNAQFLVEELTRLSIDSKNDDVAIPIAIVCFLLACTMLGVILQHYDSKNWNAVAALAKETYLTHGKIRSEYGRANRLFIFFSLLQKLRCTRDKDVSATHPLIVEHKKSCTESADELAHSVCWCRDRSRYKDKLAQLGEITRSEHTFVGIACPNPLELVYLTRSVFIGCGCACTFMCACARFTC